MRTYMYGVAIGIATRVICRTQRKRKHNTNADVELEKPNLIDTYPNLVLTSCVSFAPNGSPWAFAVPARAEP
jgi:hypothetical protein